MKQQLLEAVGLGELLCAVGCAHTLFEKGIAERCGGRESSSHLQLQKIHLLFPKVGRGMAQNKNVKSRTPKGQGK